MSHIGATKDDYTLPHTIPQLDPRVVRELNDRFQRIAEAVAKLTGSGTRVPTLENNTDLQGFRTRNASDSELDGDYVTRREVKGRAGYLNDKGEHVFTGTIVADKIVSREKARDSRTTIRRGQSSDNAKKVINNNNTIVVAGGWVAEIITCTGTTGTLTDNPIDPTTVIVILEASNLVLRYAAGAPGANEFAISGTTITVNAARTNAVLKVYYRITVTAMFAELLTGTYPTSTGTLTYTPSDVTLVSIIYTPANIPLRYTSGTPGPNEFKVVGAVWTLGRTLTADGQALAHYPIG